MNLLLHHLSSFNSLTKRDPHLASDQLHHTPLLSEARNEVFVTSHVTCTLGVGHREGVLSTFSLLYYLHASHRCFPPIPPPISLNVVVLNSYGRKAIIPPPPLVTAWFFCLLSTVDSCCYLLPAPYTIFKTLTLVVICFQVHKQHDPWNVGTVRPESDFFFDI